MAEKMLYQLYEWNHAVALPFRLAAKSGLRFWQDGPMAKTPLARAASASLELFERGTRRYGKPAFDLTHIVSGNAEYEVTERFALLKPFCALRHFAKSHFHFAQQKMLIVAPMSGHHATLLRDTVAAMLPHFDVYVTDWLDARDVPLSDGPFDLDDYTDYVIDFLKHLGGRAHVVAVCQPSVPVLAAVSLMSAEQHANLPLSMVLMGGPIDTRSNPTAVNRLADGKSLDWFRRHVIMEVPAPNKGAGRAVYPGFLQLSSFVSMNLDRHVGAHRDLFFHAMQGRDEAALKQRKFYDEYLSVMDLTAEFYLQTVERVFINHDFSNGTYRYRGKPVTPSAITDTALLTIEGERDDISGVGQTEAAHRLCSAIPAAMKKHHLQMGVGHYGVFSGSRFRKDVAPMITGFCRNNGARTKG
jgi:poly(3-hydroxybutyrate) depolymerase